MNLAFGGGAFGAAGRAGSGAGLLDGHLGTGLRGSRAEETATGGPGSNVLTGVSHVASARGFEAQNWHFKETVEH